MGHANYRVESPGPEIVVIRDLGPWDKHPTVSTDAEHVVEELRTAGLLENLRQLLYIDSAGIVDELVVENGRFARFAPGPRDGWMARQRGR